MKIMFYSEFKYYNEYSASDISYIFPYHIYSIIFASISLKNALKIRSLSIKGYESSNYICEEISVHNLYTNIVLTLANKVTILPFTS